MDSARYGLNARLMPAIVLGLLIFKYIPTSTGLGHGEKSPACGRAVFSFASIISGVSRVGRGRILVPTRADEKAVRMYATPAGLQPLHPTRIEKAL